MLCPRSLCLSYVQVPEPCQIDVNYSAHRPKELTHQILVILHLANLDLRLLISRLVVLHQVCVSVLDDAMPYVLFHTPSSPHPLL
jgi:hypothetical protein